MNFLHPLARTSFPSGEETGSEKEKHKGRRTRSKTPPRIHRASKRKRQAAFEEEKVEALEMSDAKIQINFDAPAVLRKWPSIRNERVSVLTIDLRAHAAIRS